MILWTITPIDAVLADVNAPLSKVQEVTIQGVTMMVTPMDNGFGRVERLISPRPEDYLRPEWQPGAMVPMYEHHKH